MKTKLFITYILWILLTLPCFAFKVKKSGAIDLLATDKRYFYQHEVSIYALPAYTRIQYADATNKQSSGGFDIGAGLDYRFFFHQNIGVSLGLQYMPYTGQYKFEAFQQTSSGVDNSDPLYPDNPYTYIQRYNVTEIAKLHYLEAPIKILFITPSWNNVQLRTAIGINVGYNIASKQSLSGYYDAEMIYTDNNINIDESESLLLGRYSDIAIHSPQTLLSTHISALAEIGIGIKLSQRCQLNIDLYGSYALNNTHATNNTFLGMNSSYKGIVTTNLVGDIHPFALGARVGISFYLGNPKEEILPAWKKRKLRGLVESLDAYSKDILGKDSTQTQVETIATAIADSIEKHTVTAFKEPVKLTEPTESVTPKEAVAPVEPVVPAEPVAPAEPEKPAEPNTPTEPEEPILAQAPVEQAEPIKPVPSVQVAVQNNSSQKPVYAPRALNAPIMFHLNSMELTAQSQRLLKHIVASLKENPPTKIIIIGYTCNMGGSSYNLDLGFCRAERIRYLLQQNGLAHIPIETETRGEEDPFLPNTNEQNRQENRRVELIYIY